MKLENIAMGNLLDLAINSSDSSVLAQIAADNNMNVRRAVARNRFTSSLIYQQFIGHQNHK